MFDQGGEHLVDGEDLVRILRVARIRCKREERKKGRACKPNISRIWSSNASCSIWLSNNRSHDSSMSS